jgi:hypothetical protein
MPSGGARPRSGPPPDPNALRRDRDSGDWVSLPSKREGKTPPWPLTDPSSRELSLWRVEWKRPQAVMWERNGQQVEVAVYVRSLVDAEQRGAPVAARTLVRQQQEALGLSIPGLMRNRWRIEGAEVEAPKAKRTRATARDRFKVVDGGGEG